ncbi:AAA family ATPase [Rhizobium leguminosarum]|uniref:AAA family ATPase n=1 Tax=Rhizobium leguminosarum TaxID=384 RepID=UPI00144291A1|nr:AAA family ATPase [Rhizobium leguminosarum]
MTQTAPQLETNLEELRAMSAREATASDNRQGLIFGIYDRLADHENCVANVVLVPADESGAPDWDRADPTNLESLPADEWPEDEQAAMRAAVIVDQIDGCSGDTSMLVFLRENDEPSLIQIGGPEADRDIAHAIIARDIGAAPVARPPSKFTESLAKLTAELFAPKPLAAANDNEPPRHDQRLVPYLTAFGTPQAAISGSTLFGVIVGKDLGQIYIDAKGQAWFVCRHSQRRVSLPEKPRDRFSVDWFGDLDEDTPKETIVKGVFGVNEFTLLSGKPGSGKSVITTDMACHVAAGMDWHGRKVKQGLVVYVAAERRDLTKRRMRAFRKHHGIGHVPLAVVGGRLDMTSTISDAEALAASIRELEEDCGHKCVWIIVDTLTRTFGPGDQNQSKDMSKFVLSCDTLRENVTGSHVTVIHHTGWQGDRGKGAIDLDGAVDASFLVKKEAGGYLLECDGTNDGEEGVVTHFRMEGVQVGTDEDGEPTMAPVVITHDGKTAGEHLVAKLKGHNAKALDILRGLGDDGSSVPQGLWRSAFYGEYSGVDTNILKSRFKRAKDSLVDDGLVIENESGFRLVEMGT